MTVASLRNFTVPTGSEGGAQGMLMPKLKYRFRTIVQKFGVSPEKTNITKNIMDITRPSMTHDHIVLDVYNSKINMVGKHTWDPTTINLRDDTSGIISRLVGEQMQKQFDHHEQASPVAGIDYKFIVKYEMLDGNQHNPIVLETWELTGCYIENVNYNDANYTDSQPMTISMSIRFDNALNTPIGTGIGSAVGRAAGSIATG